MSIEKSVEETLDSLDALKEVQSDIAQIIELQELQRNYAAKLIDSLKLLQAVIKDTVKINPASLGCPFHNTKEAYIAAGALLVMVGEDGCITSQQLSSLQPDNVIKIIHEYVSAIRPIIADRKQTAENSANRLEAIARGFKKIEETLNTANGTPLEQEIIQKAISEA